MNPKYIMVVKEDLARHKSKYFLARRSDSESTSSVPIYKIVGEEIHGPNAEFKCLTMVNDLNLVEEHPIKKPPQSEK
jgi:hypothetical protein